MKERDKKLISVIFLAPLNLQEIMNSIVKYWICQIIPSRSKYQPEIPKIIYSNRGESNNLEKNDIIEFNNNGIIYDD
jgi:hypothetical protein